jgi:hypothetical protein
MTSNRRAPESRPIARSSGTLSRNDKTKKRSNSTSAMRVTRIFACMTEPALSSETPPVAFGEPAAKVPRQGMTGADPPRLVERPVACVRTDLDFERDKRGADAHFAFQTA